MAEASSIIARFSFDEASGSAVSTEGSGHTMTFAGSPSRVDTVFGETAVRAIQFNGTSQYGLVAGLLDTPPAAGAIRLRFRNDIQYPNGGNIRLFSKYSLTGGNYNGLQVYLSSGGAIVASKINANVEVAIVSASAVWLAGESHDIEVSWGPAGYILKVDGVTNRRSSDTAAWQAGSSMPFCLGANYDGGASSHAAVAIDDLDVLGYQPTAGDYVAYHNFRTWDGTEGEAAEWTKYGAVLVPSEAWEGYTGAGTGQVLEPTVLKESGTYKMWYTGCTPTEYSIGYATSTDGETFEKQGIALSNANCSFVIKFGSTHHCYHTTGYSPGTMPWKVSTSSDGGATFGPPTTIFAADALAATLNCYGFANPTVFEEGGTYYALIEVRTGGGSGPWATILATSSDPIAGWAFDLDAGLLDSLQIGTGSYAPGSIHRVGSLYVLYYHYSNSSTLPSAIARAVGANIRNLTPSRLNPVGDLNEFDLIPTQDQKADPFVLEDPGIGLKRYSDINENIGDIYSLIVLDTYDGTLAELNETAGYTSTTQLRNLLARAGKRNNVLRRELLTMAATGSIPGVDESATVTPDQLRDLVAGAGKRQYETRRAVEALIDSVEE